MDNRKQSLVALLALLVGAGVMFGPRLYKQIIRLPEEQLRRYGLLAAGGLVLLLALIIGIVVLTRRARSRRLTRLADSARVWLVRPDREKKAEPATTVSVLIGLLPALQRLHASFEIVATEDGIGFYVWAPEPERLEETLRVQIQGFYPTAQIELVEDPLARFGEQDEVSYVELKLARPSAYSIRYEFKRGSGDPLGAFVEALAIQPGMAIAGVQFVARPAGMAWRRRSQSEIQRIQRKMNPPGVKKPTRRMSDAERRQLRDLESKMDAQAGYNVAVRVFGVGPDRNRVGRLVEVFEQYATGAQRFVVRRRRKQRPDEDWTLLRQRPPVTGSRNVLHAGELAALWHLPGKDLPSPSVLWAPARFLPAPLKLQAQEGTLCRIFGQARSPSGKPMQAAWEHGFSTLTHGYLLGPTGTGKTTAIMNWALQDINQGLGVLIMEPHGDLTKDVLARLPVEREADVVILNPADSTRIFGLNIMEPMPGVDRQLIAAQLMSVFQRVIGANWEGAVRMQRIIRNGVLALLEGEECPTLVHLYYFFSDEDYRDQVLANVEDPIVKSFWLKSFASWGDSEQTGAMGPPLTRVERFLSNRIVRRIISQSRSTVDFRQLMDEGRIVLVSNFSGGAVGAENAELLGAIVVAKTWMAASSRGDMAEAERPPFFCYIDEFQNYVTPDIATVLAEARKFGLGYVMANQYFEQLPVFMQQAIDGNCRTKVTFRLESAGDARRVSAMYGGSSVIKPGDLQALGAYQVYVRTLKGKEPQPVFTVDTAPPPDVHDFSRPGRIGGMCPFPEQLPIPQISPDLESLVSQLKGMMPAERVAALADLSDGDWALFQKYRRAVDRERLIRLLANPDRVPDRRRRVRLLSNLRYATPGWEADVVIARLEKQSAAALVGEDMFGF